ncbi:MAG: hypothetical protein V3W41_00190 [Planctomycetota bacterium]
MRYFEKRRITFASALIAIAVTGLCLSSGASLDRLLALARISARLALPFFLISFTASAFYTWRQHAFCAWALRNRRELGLGFALLQIQHLMVLMAIAVSYPQHFDFAAPYTFIPGALFYLAVGLLVVTSFAAWKSRMSRKVWKRLHLIGSHVVWFGFAVAMGIKASESWLFLGILALLFAAMAFRWWGRRSRVKMFAERRGAAKTCRRTR